MYSQALGDYNTERSPFESKLGNVCWERDSIREKLLVVGEMQELKLVNSRDAIKVSSGIFFLRQCCSGLTEGHKATCKAAEIPCWR